MAKSAYLAVVRDNCVLLVQNKRGVWTLPGGKHKGGETLEQTLRREVTGEELRGLWFISFVRWKTFNGKVARAQSKAKKKINATVYRATRFVGKIYPKKELIGSGWFRNVEYLTLSAVARKTIKELIADGYLKQ